MTPAIDLYVFMERDIFSSDEAWLDALAELSELAVRGLALQVRTKSEPPDRSASLAREARAVTRVAQAPVLLNGTTQEAERHDYQGVHWPEAAIPMRFASQTLLSGASVHSEQAAARAEAAGAHFLVAGTVFDAGSKPVPGEGTAKLKRICDTTDLPVLAIGGVTPQRVAECIAAGAAGVAVVSSVLKAPDKTAAVLELRDALDAAQATRGTK